MKKALALGALVSAMVIGSAAKAATVDYQLSPVGGTYSASALTAAGTIAGSGGTSRTLTANFTFAGSGTLTIVNSISSSTTPVGTLSANYITNSWKTVSVGGGEAIYSAKFTVTTNAIAGAPIGSLVTVTFSSNMGTPLSAGNYSNYSTDSAVSAATVPLPASVMSGSALLGGLALARRRK